MILRICFVAIVTAISAVILKINKPEYVPVCLTAGGVLLLVFAFDYLSASLEFIKQFAQQTGIDSSLLRLIFKIVGIGYLIELTSGAVKDLGFESLADKLVLCGKLIIFLMAVPILKTMFTLIISLADMA